MMGMQKRKGFDDDDPREKKKLEVGECSKKKEGEGESDEDGQICNICLDAIKERFGVFPNCSHSYCLECISRWRGLERGGSWKNSRSCPVCKRFSYYVVPSETWPTNVEEKRRCIEGYLAKCRSTPCKHFAGGNGSCPHRYRCFYEHRVMPDSYRWIHHRSPPPPPPLPFDCDISMDEEILRILESDYSFEDGYDSAPDSIS